MKKIILFLITGFLLASCTNSVKLNVEDTVKQDQTYMKNKVKKENKWFETQITLKEFLDEECTGEISNITNVFQVAAPDFILILQYYGKFGFLYNIIN